VSVVAHGHFVIVVQA